MCTDVLCKQVLCSCGLPMDGVFSGQPWLTGASALSFRLHLIHTEGTFYPLQFGEALWEVLYCSGASLAHSAVLPPVCLENFYLSL